MCIDSLGDGKTLNAFFAYPSSKPTLAESIKAAIKEFK